MLYVAFVSLERMGVVPTKATAADARATPPGLAGHTTVLVRLTDGRARAFVFPDQASAFRWYRFHGDLVAAKVLTFYLRVPGGAARVVIAGTDVASVELVDRREADEHAADCQDAFFPE
jgi:hypothetical protein